MRPVRACLECARVRPVAGAGRCGTCYKRKYIAEHPDWRPPGSTDDVSARNGPRATVPMPSRERARIAGRAIRRDAIMPRPDEFAEIASLK